MNNNQLQARKVPFSAKIQSTGIKKLINETLGDPKRSMRFISSITSAVAVNSALQECEFNTVLTGALLGESLNLSLSPQLGQYYLVPFNNRKKGIKEAQFVLGYKGYIQLAIRSGYYKKINVIEIKQGELVGYNPLREDIECEFIEDFTERENAETVGYYAYFEYTNGFEKAIYWSKDKMLSHADKYSPAFSRTAYEKLEKGEIPQSELWKYSSSWYNDFDGMAKKTMLRQLISKWGIMSLEIQQAFISDGGTIERQGTDFIPSFDDPEPQEEYPETENFIENPENVVDEININEL